MADQLTYPLGNKDKKILKDVVNEFLDSLVIDSNWNRYWYIFEWLSALSWRSLLGGSGSFNTTAGSNDLNLVTGTTLSSSAEIYRNATVQNVLTWGRVQKFRCSFRIAFSDNNFLAFIVRGNAYLDQYYGFKISGNTLYGVASVYNPIAGNSEKLVTINLSQFNGDGLSVVETQVTYDVEVDFYPKDKAVFFVLNKTTGIYQQVGVISGSGIPSGTGILESQTYFADIWLQTTNTVNKTMTVNYFEYIQQRFARNAGS